MNLTKLFEIQRILDEKIVKEKGLEGQDLLDKKILALQVELGELANEWQMFKFWKEDNKPKRAYNKGCDNCVGGISKLSPLFGPYKECEICRVNPLLEEYVDCLHFILSIGLELGISNFNFIDEDLPKELKNTTYHFNQIFLSIADVRVNIKFKRLVGIADEYCNMFNLFLLLSKPLGFTWKQIEQAYYAKNKINHERQANGY